MRKNMGKQPMFVMHVKRVSFSRKTSKSTVVFILARANFDVQTVQIFTPPEHQWIHIAEFMKIASTVVLNAPHFQQTPLLIYANMNMASMAVVGKPLVGKDMTGHQKCFDTRGSAASAYSSKNMLKKAKKTGIKTEKKSK